MAHYVICSVCGQRFNRDKEPFIKTSTRRYAHIKCAENYEASKTQEQKDRENLEQYILKLFNIEYLTPRIQKQIGQYVNEYNYTYSGIHKALVYFFEIKHNSIEKANGAIGIVPYIYDQAYEYYYSLWQAQEKNKNKNIQEYISNTIEIRISPPKRKPKKRKLFCFLDKEE